MGAAVAAPIIAGTALSAYSQYRQGQVAAAAARQNAQLAEINRGQALQAGASAAARVTQQARRVGSSVIARAGAGNVDVGSGSPAAALGAFAGGAGQEAEIVRMNAIRQAWGFTVEAQQQRFKASEATTAGTLGAVGTTIGGFGMAAGRFGR